MLRIQSEFRWVNAINIGTQQSIGPWQFASSAARFTSERNNVKDAGVRGNLSKAFAAALEQSLRWRRHYVSEVLTAQSIAHNDERVAVQIWGRKLTTADSLIKALGGGWNTSQLPSLAEVGAKP